MGESGRVPIALYRALSRCAGRLQQQVIRHGYAHVFTKEEYSALSLLEPDLTSVLARVCEGDEDCRPSPLQKLLRERFGSPQPHDPSHSTSKEAKDSVSCGFAVLALVNQRVKIMEKLAYEPHSDVCTEGVRVKVSSRLDPWLAHHNDKDSGRSYTFSYKVKITNESAPEPVRLVNRYWAITDITGHTQEVSGPGVVGLHPVIEPGKSYEYMSAVHLSHMKGSMSGTYMLITTGSGRVFPAEVAPFALCPPTT